jgi:hypothetical protein
MWTVLDDNSIKRLMMVPVAMYVTIRTVVTRSKLEYEFRIPLMVLKHIRHYPGSARPPVQKHLAGKMPDQSRQHHLSREGSLSDSPVIALNTETAGNM